MVYSKQQTVLYFEILIKLAKPSRAHMHTTDILSK